MDELAAYKVFVRVAKNGSFSKVGRLLGQSTSTVARTVTRLEEELGVRLLNRTTRQVVLTEAGQRFYNDAINILQSVDEAKLGVKSQQQEMRGAIRVHTARSVGSNLILPALPRFLNKHPSLTVDLSLTEERADLLAEKVDVAIWRGKLDDSGLIARPLASPRRVICGSPKYFKKKGIPTQPQDLVRHNCLVYSALHYPNEWTFLRGQEETSVKISGNLRVDTGTALFSSTLNGLGIAVLPEWLVHEACKRQELQIILSDYEVQLSDHDTSLSLVYPHRAPAPKVTSFIDFVLQLFY
ncbi:LysR family transcriptional regulator [Advenella sp. WQ 585]|uniref:LysR family transcriptional regulator n=1 Tax=Advenella mandrilli TaxID=2800330 RepID=A0ABS1ECU9_9BURK|nr:LysR family transcriptional regulator [Advenella mandrilli]MBK1781756.1 LysR family transcriptional regulator [Advenella mandrilli]